MSSEGSAGSQIHSLPVPGHIWISTSVQVLWSRGLSSLLALQLSLQSSSSPMNSSVTLEMLQVQVAQANRWQQLSPHRARNRQREGVNELPKPSLWDYLGNKSVFQKETLAFLLHFVIVSQPLSLNCHLYLYSKNLINEFSYHNWIFFQKNYMVVNLKCFYKYIDFHFLWIGKWLLKSAKWKRVNFQYFFPVW